MSEAAKGSGVDFKKSYFACLKLNKDLEQELEIAREELRGTDVLLDELLSINNINAIKNLIRSYSKR